ncbi:GNAT family N-acetyltransferase [Alkalicoccobacillus porphyridii]|uniref:GNAT family N-acetyltransferase n=1 Tax=Alkalicoccobacillus porphyridii TaxID=2597270 RepID=A0A553ZX18_9BACI|nr:GNAT family N-acetyltransferase [Alkalicoccobacillus porphyridii]TSB45994.1 GNAT family N-acetyltransferase [Alkalicoccobacillus porphyridii]
MNIQIRELKSIDTYIDALSKLMQDTVNAGASIGFLAPMEQGEAELFWQKRNPNESRIMLGAFQGNQLIGTVYVELEQKPNGSHRGEICKLMVHPDARRLGAARALMQEIEKKAIEQKRSLLILDTREGDAANRLYRSLGYQFAGAIPNFARNEKGVLETTNLYYKIINNSM